jgi:hypothetical protein
MLEKSKGLVVKDDLEGAMKAVKAAYDAAERALHEMFSVQLSQAQEIIIQAKEMGEDISIYEDQLSRAKSAIENQEYESAASLIKEAIEGAGDNVKSQVNNMISRAEELVTAGEELGADTGRIRNHVEKARGSLDSLRYKEALAYAKRGVGDGENIISSKFQETSREVREGIRKLKGVNEDATMPQNLLDQAQEAIKEKKYIEALHALTLAKEKVQKGQFESVLEVISRARDKFVLAKKVGVDMSRSMTLLNTARDSYNIGRFEDAIKYAEQAQKEIEASLEVFYKARDDLVELAKAIKAASDIGVDVSELKASLAEAKKSFEDKAYKRTAEITKEALERSKTLAHEMTRQSIDETGRSIEVAKGMNVDTERAEAELSKASESLAEDDLSEALGHARAGQDSITTALTRALTDKLDNLEQFIKGYPEGQDLDDVPQLIEQARAEVVSKDFQKASTVLRDITQSIERSGEETCRKLMERAEGKLAALNAMGGDVSDLEILMTRAKDSLDKRVYDEASMKAKDIVTHSDEQMVKLIQAEFSAFKDAVEEARTIGIDVDETKTSLKEARAKADAGDFSEAHRIVADAKAVLRSKISQHDAVKEKIRRTEELIQEASRTKADTTPMTRRLDGAKGVFSEGRVDEAEKLLDDLLVEAERSLAMYLAAKSILAIKETIDLAQEYDVPMEGAQKSLVEAKDLMKRKSYEEALVTAKRGFEESRSTLAKAVEGMVKDLQRLLTDAKNVGIDTAGPEKLAEKASALVGTGEFNDALKCIQSARDDIDHVKSLSTQASVEIRTARSNLRDAETLDMDVGRARELLEQAVDALTRHQYAIALELARKSSDASIDISKSRIWETLERLKERVDKAGTEGAPMGMAERCISEGVQFFKDGRYQDALRQVMLCEAEMERAELQREISTKAVENSRRKLEEAAVLGIKSKEFSDLVERAEAFLAEGKFVEAMTAAIESGDELHSIRESLDSVRIEFSAVKEQIERLKKVNIDTSDLDEMLEIAHDNLSKHELTRAQDALRRCAAKAASLFENSMTDVVAGNQALIAKARSMGINTKPCEDLLEVARTSFAEKLWDFAYQQAQSCRVQCIELIGRKMSSLISDVKAKSDALANIGASVKTVEEVLEEADRAARSGDSEAAFSALMTADQRLQQVEETHKKYVDISLAAESAVQVLAAYGIASKEAERLLALADIEKERDYDSAIEFVAEALDSAKTMMESYSPELIGTMSTDGLQAGNEGAVILKVSNGGRALAKDLKVEVEGDYDLVGADLPGAIRPSDEASVAIRVVPKSSGTVPLKVRISAKRHLDGRLQTFEFEDALKVFDAGPPFKVARASEPAKCVSCQGRIKPGFDVVDCRCGNTLHLACAKRGGKCPVCGQKYSF